MLVKVCGMKDRHQIQQLEKLRPDFIGLIFYERSPRFVTEPLDGLPKEVQRVGVFVNADLGYLQEKTGQYRLDLIQLHGNESPKYCRKVRALGCGLLKAFSLTAPLCRRGDRSVRRDLRLLSLRYSLQGIRRIGKDLRLEPPAIVPRKYPLPAQRRDTPRQPGGTLRLSPPAVCRCRPQQRF